MEIIDKSSVSSENSDKNNRLTLHDKLELKEEIKRLFQSDCLHTPSEIKKL